jgi:hypothetical protein
MEHFSKKIKKIKNKFPKLIKFSVLIIGAFVALKLLGLLLIFIGINLQAEEFINNKSLIVNQASITPTLHPLLPIPSKKILSNGGYHIFQTFNNCGPAALSMALRFYGVKVSQEELGQTLRPYQVQGGDNDDKSVTLSELAKKSKELGFIPYHRPMGNPEIIKQFIANDIPVITRTWTKPNEDIGHYRIIKGYDDTNGTFLQDDSLQNKNLTYTYEEFNEIWKKFNYEYLVLIPKEKQKIAEQILGTNADEKISWQNAVNNSLNELAVNPNDIYSRFNLSVAYYNTDKFQYSVEEFEKVENHLPFRTLWYQIEPIQAYFELGNYDRVFQITDKILNNQNRAFSELYILRGKIYQKQGNTDAARNEFEKAVFYNSNLKEIQNLL